MRPSDKKEYDRAIQDYNETIRLDPKNGDFFRGRGYAYKAKGDTIQAEKDFAEYRRLTGKEP